MELIAAFSSVSYTWFGSTNEHPGGKAFAVGDVNRQIIYRKLASAI